MSKIADNTGIASLSMLEKMMGPLKAEKTKNIATFVGDMTPLAPEIRELVGAEPMGMGESILSATSLITGIPMAVAKTLTRSSGAVDEAFDILKTFKTTEDIEKSIFDMFRVGTQMRESGDKIKYIEGSNLTNNAQRLLKKSQDEGLVNRNVNLTPASKRIEEIAGELLRETRIPPLTQVGKRVTGVTEEPLPPLTQTGRRVIDEFLPPLTEVGKRVTGVKKP